MDSLSAIKDIWCNFFSPLRVGCVVDNHEPTHKFSLEFPTSAKAHTICLLNEIKDMKASQVQISSESSFSSVFNHHSLFTCV